jgi:uncharacterized protein
MFGKLTMTEIEVILHQEILGRLGCHSDGITYVVPVSYAYDGAYLYCRSMEGMKINFMRMNPKVCFQVDHMENKANWKSVIVWGDYEELTDPKLRSEALQKLVERKLPIVSSATMQLSSLWPFPEQDQGDIKGIVFRILVKEKTGRFESDQVISTEAF